MIDGQIYIPVSESPEALALLEECFRNTKKYFKGFLPDNFNIEFSSLHDKILSAIDVAKPKKKVVVQAPRGIGKTTMARGVAAKAICYATAKFIVYVSNSSTSAELQTENLKKDLMSAEIRKYFGNVKTRPADLPVEEGWSKKSWVASTAGGEHFTLILPRGSGQQIRGLLWKDPTGRNVRPDLIIFDDLEDTETIENEEQRKKREVWFFGDALKCIDKTINTWQMLYIDTLKHFDALIQKLMNASDWISVDLSICDESYKSLAPDFMSDEDIQDELKIHREAGLMDVFAREYMGMAISKEDAAFRVEYFQYYRESDKEFLDQKGRLINVLIVDPARATKIHSAETGFVVWGVNPEHSKLFVRYAAGERLHPDEVWERCIELCAQFEARVIGIEDTGLGEYATYPLVNAILSKGMQHIDVIGLKARRGSGEFSGSGGGKKMRVASLIGYYRQGLVYHNEIGTGAYETQLLSFPRSKRWDIMDAAGYITQMLDEGNIFFYPPGMEDESRDSVEKEYEQLEKELEEEETGIYADWRYAP